MEKEPNREPVLERKDPARILAIVLALISVTLILISWFLYRSNEAILWSDENLRNWYNWFDPAAEYTVTAYFSVVLWVILSILSFMIAYIAPQLRWAWYTVATVAFIAAFDEALMLHEYLNFYATWFEYNVGLSIITYPWLYIGMVIVAILGLLLIPLMLRLPRNVLAWLVSGALVFLIGAMGFENLDGHLGSYYETITWQIALGIHLEELFEMLGIVLAIVGVTRMAVIFRSEDAVVVRWLGYRTKGEPKKLPTA